MKIRFLIPTGRYGGAVLFALLALFMLSPQAARATETLSLEMPIHCTPGDDCWLVNYVDTDPSPAVADYACGRASYNGHKGVDIAIVDAARMREGVPVYASAAGVVRGTRNNMTDIDFTLNGGPKSVAGKECGNGVLIDHGQGWTTQYCHMRKGSVDVRRGEMVTSGSKIGLVGMSGLSQFPHVHIQVRHNGKIVDPFAGVNRKKKCGAGKNPLWNSRAMAAMKYQPTAIYNAGFASSPPNQRMARDGLYDNETLFSNSPVIALWADIFWVRAGDKITFLISDPNGRPLAARTSTVKKSSARHFAFAGLRRKNRIWPKGTYIGQIRLNRPASGKKFTVIRTIEIN